jgi:hypothetical protein
MDRPLRGFARERKRIRSRTKGRDLKKQIVRVLEAEKVAYEMEIARRIDVTIHRTIKKTLDTMFLQGELDRSDVETVHKNIKVRFYWRRNTNNSTVRRISKLKKQLLRAHMIYSTVQKRFGAKLAIASLKVLAQSGYVPLNSDSIKGPLTKWNGPNDEWSEDPIVIPYGDIDVLALQNDGERLWLGEVKMRGDLLKTVQVQNFYASAIRFKLKIYTYKGIDFPLKLFILIPISTVSANEYCFQKSIEVLECKKAYYPSETTKWGSLSSFYERYMKVMGFRNLRLVPPKSLPVDEITELMKSLGGKDLRDTI